MHTLLAVYDTSSLSMFSKQQPLVSLVIVTMVMGVTVSPCGDRDIYHLATAGAEHPFWTCFHLCFLPFAYFLVVLFTFLLSTSKSSLFPI